MVITPSKAVIELPTMANWELLALLASQEFPKEDASSAVQDQRVITSGQETKPSIESTCERVGYRIGRFLGDVVQARQQFRSVQKVSSFNPATAPITATATPGNTSSVLTPQMLTCEWSPVSLVDYPKKYQVYVVVARILRRIKMFAAELLNDLKSAMVDVLKGRVA
ncbi:MAG TPA: hypothetical protein VFA32_09740, partial [Dehalococcoidia bacterium]|nr:hypothetical protein [Dehalococcoidia bacterium]